MVLQRSPCPSLNSHHRIAIIPREWQSKDVYIDLVAKMDEKVEMLLTRFPMLTQIVVVKGCFQFLENLDWRFYSDDAI